jgi:hypothetical protein
VGGLTSRPGDLAQLIEGGVHGDEARAETAWGLLGTVHNLAELATRPYLLSLISEQLDKVERFRREGKPVNAARLYGEFVDQWFRRDDGKHTLRPDHKRLLMEGLAAQLWRDGAKELPPDKLDAFLDRFLYEAPVIGAAYAGVSRDLRLEDLRTACFVFRVESRRVPNPLRFKRQHPPHLGRTHRGTAPDDFSAAGGEWVVFDERAQQPLRCSPGAWRWTGWLAPDARGVLQRLPLEAFGPVEGLD